jgi:UDP-N-acetylmuramoylalanine--D-glutamate ligase
MATYLKMKSRIFLNQDENDTAVVNIDDSELINIKTKARRFCFSRKTRPDFGAYVKSGKDTEIIRVVIDGKVLGEIDWKNYSMFGSHNQENLMAAIGLSMSLGADPEKALINAIDFTVADHRLELVGRFGGVSYYDDSKGTNVGAVITALQNFPSKSVILILGGRDKNLDFASLKEPVKEKVKHLVLMGEAKDKIKLALKDASDYTCVNSMVDAVSVCKTKAKSGDIVLLSPACASFDMFSSYKERGKVFQEETRRQNSDLT